MPTIPTPNYRHHLLLPLSLLTAAAAAAAAAAAQGEASAVMEAGCEDAVLPVMALALALAPHDLDFSHLVELQRRPRPWLVQASAGSRSWVGISRRWLESLMPLIERDAAGGGSPRRHRQGDEVTLTKVIITLFLCSRPLFYFVVLAHE